MEGDTCRRLSSTHDVSHTLLRILWLGGANSHRHRFHNRSLRRGMSITGPSRIAPQRAAPAVRLQWYLRGIHLRDAVQIVPRTAVAALHVRHGRVLPRNVLRVLSDFQYVTGIGAIEWIGAIFGYCDIDGVVVRHCSAVRVFWCVLRLPTFHLVSHGYLPRAADDTTFSHRLPQSLSRSHRGDHTLRVHLSRIVFHNDLPLDESILLRFRVHPPRFPPLDHHHGRNHYPVLVLSVLGRESPVAMVGVFEWWQHRFVRDAVQCGLGTAIAAQWYGVDAFIVFWVYVFDLVCYLFGHRYHRVR
mmetsp:Transcript_45202/g.54415  ORF Transcript_45202/g.54415 Transcript_45202/m.54415 type:complete len:301 (+) Transcript_45202:58-960(+)